MEPTTIALNKIQPGNNPRKYFDPREMDQLVASIRALGILQPPLVRHIDGTDEYQLIAGEKRVRAARLAELTQIPVLVRVMSDDMAAAAALVENVQRGNMSAAEEARAAQVLLLQNEGDRDETARILGWPIERLDKRLAILACAPAVLDALTQRTIQLGHAELLAAVPTDKQIHALPKIIQGNLSVVHLKASIGKLAHRLDDAVFDQTPCLNCPHNSAQQQAMFAEHIGEGYCTKPEHYEALTALKLDEIAAAKRPDYPQVKIYRKEDGFVPLYLSAEGTMGVGDAQAQACRSCANYGCAISAVPGTVGQIVEPLCFNAACNQKHVAARIRSDQTVTTTSQTAALKSPAHSPDKRPTPAHKSSAKPNAVPNSVAIYRVEQWRKMLARELHQQRDKGQALLIALALTRNLSYVDQSRFRTALEKSQDDLPVAPTLIDAVEYVHEQLGMDHSQTLALIPSVAAFGMPEDALVKLLGFLNVDVAAHWKLNKEFLNCMTKSEIDSLADELGLKKALTASYAKLAGGKKEEFVSALLKIEGVNYAGLVPKLMRYSASKATDKMATSVTANEAFAALLSDDKTNVLGALNDPAILPQ